MHLNIGFLGSCRWPQFSHRSHSLLLYAVIGVHSPRSTQYGHRMTFSMGRLRLSLPSLLPITHSFCGLHWSARQDPSPYDGDTTSADPCWISSDFMVVGKQGTQLYSLAATQKTASAKLCQQSGLGSPSIASIARSVDSLSGPFCHTRRTAGCSCLFASRGSAFRTCRSILVSAPRKMKSA